MTMLSSEAEKAMINGEPHHDSGTEITTHHLIVGTGPAGGALASFLAQHGEYSRDPPHCPWAPSLTVGFSLVQVWKALS